jgi:hypothetical protein
MHHKQAIGCGSPELSQGFVILRIDDLRPEWRLSDIGQQYHGTTHHNTFTAMHVYVLRACCVLRQGQSILRRCMSVRMLTERVKLSGFLDMARE